jgi:hypothetical protein
MWPERRERYAARGNKERKYGQKRVHCETESYRKREKFTVIRD